jgi:CTD small phosphatase-like protein 2
MSLQNNSKQVLKRAQTLLYPFLLLISLLKTLLSHKHTSSPLKTPKKSPHTSSSEIQTLRAKLKKQHQRTRKHHAQTFHEKDLHSSLPLLANSQSQTLKSKRRNSISMLKTPPPPHAPITSLPHISREHKQGESPANTENAKQRQIYENWFRTNGSTLNSEGETNIFEEIAIFKTLPEKNKDYLLKRKTIGKSNKKVVLLFDIDETLVYSQQIQDAEEGLTVKLRPHVKTVLKKISKKFQIGVFTSGIKQYGNFVADLIDPKNKFIKKRYFRDSCVKVNGKFVKDLRIFRDRDLCKIILVDNSILSFKYQINNGVLIPPFYGQKEDTALLQLYGFLKNFKNVDNVQPLLKRTFKLEKQINLFSKLFH